MRKKKIYIAVFVSGGGTNLQAIIDKLAEEKTNLIIKKVISDRDCYGLERGKNHNIEAIQLKRKNFSNQALPHLKGIDFIVLAGFLSILNEAFCSQFQNRILNLHPSLLPKYGGIGMYGSNVHKAVLENNDKESGCTVHFVTPGVDKGQILFQEKVAVDTTDSIETLAEKVHRKEYLALPLAVLFLGNLFQYNFVFESIENKKLNEEGIYQILNLIVSIQNNQKEKALLKSYEEKYKFKISFEESNKIKIEYPINN